MRLKTFKLFIIPVFILLNSLQCEDRVPLAIINNSDKSLYVFINNEWPGNGPTYPDTTLRGDGEIGGYEKIYPKRRQYFEELRGENGIATFQYLGDTLSFVICDVEVIEKYPWRTIKENYMVQQRYDLSLQDLQKLDYTLYYPPIGIMRDMKMWPRYDADR